MPSNASRTPTLIFVYNADSGLFNGLADLAHKMFSPETYACRLCALTYSHFGMRQEWKQFLDGLNRPFEFLHRDELRQRYGITGVALPAIFIKENGSVRVWLDAAAINACQTMEDLKRLIVGKLDS